MQNKNNDSFDIDKRKMCNGQYEMPLPTDSGTWTQVQEHIRAKIQ